MGIFDNGPLSDQELKASRVEYVPTPPKPRRNTTVIRATRVCDGETFEFHGWQAVELVGFDRLRILDSLSAFQPPTRRHKYQPAGIPVEGFTWEVVDPQDHPVLLDTYMPIY